MEVVILRDVGAVAHAAADVVERLLQSKPDAVLGLAAGDSPVPTYEELVRRHCDGRITFARATMFLLDEYVGLPAEHPASFRRFVREHLTDHVDVVPEAVHGPDGTAADLEAECAAYEEAIARSGGVDVQLLGIGGDGHIAFNEPGSSLGSRTRVETLTERTRSDNARFFDDATQVPRHAITQGVATILDARHVVVIACGASKADALARIVEGPVTARVPGSALQLHPLVTVLTDEEAAAQLELAQP